MNPENILSCSVTVKPSTNIKMSHEQEDSEPPRKRGRKSKVFVPGPGRGKTKENQARAAINEALRALGENKEYITEEDSSILMEDILDDTIVSPDSIKKLNCKGVIIIDKFEVNINYFFLIWNIFHLLLFCYYYC